MAGDRLTPEAAEREPWHATIDYHLQSIAAATHASKARFAEPIRKSLVAIDETVRAHREQCPNRATAEVSS